MQLSQENPDFIYVLRGISPAGVLVNQETLATSFVLTPNQLVQDWRPTAVDDLQPQDMDAVLESLSRGITQKMLHGAMAELRTGDAEARARATNAIQHFFEHYKDLEKGKWVKVAGWGDLQEARAEILKAAETYKAGK